MIVDVPTGEFDVLAMEPPQFCVINRLNRFPVTHCVMMAGWIVDKSGQPQNEPLQWCEVRAFDDERVAQALCADPQRGVISPEQIPDWSPSFRAPEATGVHIETVADIHRGLRRRR